MALAALMTALGAQAGVQRAPVLSIDIPTVSLTDYTPPTDTNLPVSQLGLPWISQYAVGVYSYAVSIAGILAGVMLVVAGFQYLTAGGDASRVSKAKDRIKDAIIGMFLVFGAYTILLTVNPDLVYLTTVRITPVAAEVGLFQEQGTGNPTVSDPADQQVASYNLPAPDAPPPGGGGGGSTGGTGGGTGGGATGGGGGTTGGGGGDILGGGSSPSPTPTPPPTGGGGGASGAPPANIPPDQQANVSNITWEESLGGTGNLLKYCTKRNVFDEGTYEQKMQYLAKSVLGFIEVCVRHSKCAYGQGGFTPLPNGPAAASWLPNFSVKALAAHSHPPEEVFASNSDCLDRWNKRGKYESEKLSGPFLTNAEPACIALANAAMKQYYLAPINENKIFVGDCGTTVRQILKCAGVDMGKNDIPTKYKGKPTGYPSALNLDEHKDNPRMIISTYQKNNLDEAAASKGGMRFGDMVYICCDGDTGSYNAHWMLYVGGRPEIPYSFIEMGGNPAAPTSAKFGAPNIPGWGGTGGVVVKKNGLTLEQFLRPKFSPQPPSWCKPCSKGCPCTVPPSKNVNNGLVFVWRPIPAPDASSTPPPSP